MAKVGLAAARALARIWDAGYRGAVLLGDELARLYVVELEDDGCRLRAIIPAPDGVEVPLGVYMLPALALGEDWTPERCVSAVLGALTGGWH